MSPVVLGVAVVGGPGFGLTIVEAWPLHACGTRTTRRRGCLYLRVCAQRARPPAGSPPSEADSTLPAICLLGCCSRQ